MFVCFFFFKQKTAYELRISDWSSDVCSSDLVVILQVEEQRPRASHGTHALGTLGVVELHAELDAAGLRADPLGEADGDAEVGGVDADEDAVLRFDVVARHAEIGRASCRERVCQYV